MKIKWCILYNFFYIFLLSNSLFAAYKKSYEPYLTPGKLTILVTFDGSKNLKKWDQIIAFSKKQNFKCTFFVSGVYLIPDHQKNLYIFPKNKNKTGLSDIGFGGTAQQVRDRALFFEQVFLSILLF